jgi:hypothetical protein
MGPTKSKQKRQQIIKNKITSETTNKSKIHLSWEHALQWQVVEQAKFGLP